MATFLTFEDIEAYKLARNLRKEILRFCRTLPKEETFLLRGSDYSIFEVSAGKHS